MFGFDWINGSMAGRYMVLPRRPPNAAGLNPEQLEALVTRNSMIGCGLPQPPVGHTRL